MQEYKGMRVMKYGKYDAVRIDGHHLADKNGFVYLHRLIAEEMLGRPLKHDESVHHIDENKRNNAKDNLMVFKTSGDHAAYHGGRVAVLDGDVWVCREKGKYVCKNCGNRISKNATYCMECADKLFRHPHIKTRNDADELQRYVDSGMTKEAIAEIYGVSGKAVAKWMNKWGIKPINDECENVAEFLKDVQIYSLLSLEKKYGVPSSVMRKWARKYNGFIPKDVVICIETGKQYTSGNSAMRDIAPDENAKVNAEKMYEAARNGEPFKGYHWIIEKKKNWGEVA